MLINSQFLYADTILTSKTDYLSLCRTFSIRFANPLTDGKASLASGNLLKAFLPILIICSDGVQLIYAKFLLKACIHTCLGMGRWEYF